MHSQLIDLPDWLKAVSEAGRRRERPGRIGRQIRTGALARREVGPLLEDQQGCLLRYIYTVGGNGIEMLLIGECLARACTRDGQHRGTLMRMEEGARQHAAGCLRSVQSTTEFDLLGPDRDCGDFVTWQQA